MLTINFSKLYWPHLHACMRRQPAFWWAGEIFVWTNIWAIWQSIVVWHCVQPSKTRHTFVTLWQITGLKKANKNPIIVLNIKKKYITTVKINQCKCNSEQMKNGSKDDYKMFLTPLLDKHPLTRQFPLSCIHQLLFFHFHTSFLLS